MHYFKFVNNYLYCEKVKVEDICKEDIETPFFLYSRKTIEHHFTKLDQAFSDMDHIICYSIKSNSNLAILELLKNLGSGADIVSGGELFKALKAGIDPRKIVYSGVGKTDEEIKEAINANILMFNVESEEEIDVLDEIAGKLGKKAGVALRVNPDVDPRTHEKITTGTESNKFGIPLEDTEAVYLKIRKKKNLKILGIDCHIGSQILSPEPYINTIKIIRKVIFSLAKQHIDLKYLNIGGGFGIVYNNENPSTADEFRKAVDHLISDLNLTIIMEPGRFIVGNAGILVTKVLFTKKTGIKRFVIVDAGMNDLIRPTLYDAFHAIHPISPVNPTETKVDIVGPVCESGDYFAKDRMLPQVKRGDFLAIMSAGAYGFSMSSNYNSRRRATEVMVDCDKFTIIRSRETYNDLIRLEL